MPPEVGFCFGFSVPLSKLKEIGEFRYFPLNIGQLLSETVYSLGKYQTHLFASHPSVPRPFFLVLFGSFRFRLF